MCFIEDIGNSFIWLQLCKSLLPFLWREFWIIWNKRGRWRGMLDRFSSEYVRRITPSFVLLHPQWVLTPTKFNVMIRWNWDSLIYMLKIWWRKQWHKPKTTSFPFGIKGEKSPYFGTLHQSSFTTTSGIIRRLDKVMSFSV